MDRHGVTRGVGLAIFFSNAPGRDKSVNPIHRKRLKIDKDNPSNAWTFEYERNKAELALMILLYLYSNDDQILSRKESRNLIRFIRNASQYLTEQDQDRIREVMKEKLSMPSLFAFFERKEYKRPIIDDSIHEIERLVVKQKSYFSLLTTLKKKLVEE